jgi:hypothetical protein
VARHNSDGTGLDTTFQPSSTIPGSEVLSVAINTAGTIAVAGHKWLSGHSNPNDTLPVLWLLKL